MINPQQRRLLFILLVILASLGLSVGIIIHIRALAGIPLRDGSPLVAVLHIGAIGLFLTAVIFVKSGLRSRAAIQQSGNSRKRPRLREQLKTVFQGTPKWMMYLCIAGFFYTLINWFFFLANSGGGGPHIMDGNFVIANHGEIIRIISEPEYYAARANELRGFSGHWMLFYSVAAGVFYGRLRLIKKNLSETTG